MTMPPFAWPWIAQPVPPAVIPPGTPSGSTNFVQSQSGVFPTGWRVFRDAAGGNSCFVATLVQASGSPITPIVFHSPQAANGNDAARCNFDLNSTRKPGWFSWQSPLEAAGNARFMVAQRMQSAVPLSFSVVTRFAMEDLTGAGANNLDGALYWGVFGDGATSDVPGVISVAGQRRIMLRLGPNTTSGNWEVTLFVADGTANSTITRSLGVNTEIHALGEYLRLDRDNTTGTVYAYIGNEAGAWSLIGSIAGPSAGASVDLRWFGFSHVQRNENSIVGFNYFRRYAANGVL